MSSAFASCPRRSSSTGALGTGGPATSSIRTSSPSGPAALASSTTRSSPTSKARESHHSSSGTNRPRRCSSPRFPQIQGIPDHGRYTSSSPGRPAKAGRMPQSTPKAWTLSTSTATAAWICSQATIGSNIKAPAISNPSRSPISGAASKRASSNPARTPRSSSPRATAPVP